MYSVIFQSQLQRHVRLATKLGCLPFLWSSSEERLYFTGRRALLPLITFQMLFLAFYTVAQFLHTLTGSYTIQQKMMALVFSSVYYTATSMMFNWGHDKVPMEMINAFLNFEKKFKKAKEYKKSLADRILIAVAPTIFFTAIVLPVTVVMFLALYPCAPPFLGSMTPLCGSTLSHNPFPFPVRIGILIMEFLAMFDSTFTGTFYNTLVLLPGIVCLWNYLRVILKEERLNSRGKINFREYSQVQMLDILNLNRICNSKLRMTAFLTGLPAIQFFSSFVSIRLHGSVNFPQFLLFPLLYLDTAGLTVIFLSVAAKVFQNSKGLLRLWRKRSKGRLERRRLNALAPVKIRFGTNYVSQETPLVVQDFCICNTVNVLLLSKQ